MDGLEEAVVVETFVVFQTHRKSLWTLKIEMAKSRGVEDESKLAAVRDTTRNFVECPAVWESIPVFVFFLTLDLAATAEPQKSCPLKRLPPVKTFSMVSSRATSRSLLYLYLTQQPSNHYSP